EKEDLEVIDNNGISRKDALNKFGLNTSEIFTNQVIKSKDDILLYLEMHIEQGPILEMKNIPIGIVSHITGVTVYDVIIEGKSDHAGTTPMDLRTDALTGACKLKLALENIVSKHG